MLTGFLEECRLEALQVFVRKCHVAPLSKRTRTRLDSWLAVHLKLIAERDHPKYGANCVGWLTQMQLEVFRAQLSAQRDNHLQSSSVETLSLRTIDNNSRSSIRARSSSVAKQSS
jgi:hypothetical protein